MNHQEEYETTNLPKDTCLREHLVVDARLSLPHIATMAIAITRSLSRAASPPHNRLTRLPLEHVPSIVQCLSLTLFTDGGCFFDRGDDCSLGCGGTTPQQRCDGFTRKVAAMFPKRDV